MGIEISTIRPSSGGMSDAEKMQELAVAGGTDNKSDPDKNWYPIDTDEQYETALNYILYSDMDDAGSLVRYEIDCGTPDSGNHIYFYGKHALLGNTTSPTSAKGLLKATHENGKYYIKIGKQDNMTFDWGVVQADSKGNILKIEKSPLHTSDETSPTFNGWEDRIILTIKPNIDYLWKDAAKVYAWVCGTSSGGQWIKCSKNSDGSAQLVLTGLIASDCKEIKLVRRKNEITNFTSWGNNSDHWNWSNALIYKPGTRTYTCSSDWGSN
jgi:hypothetical protein